MNKETNSHKTKETATAIAGLKRKGLALAVSTKTNLITPFGKNNHK